ncbi:MAG: polysaccharide biosynthesis tyrosine autokinase [Gemmatimonadaceae bacterium]|nr:polysaccharide biosynthesis tyrosine autokinase [Gemmatimonadaceae bacterium]
MQPLPGGPDPDTTATSIQVYGEGTSTALTAPSAFSGDRPRAAATGFARYWAGIKRFKWLIVLLGLLGAGGGVLATTFLKPEYAVQSTVRITLDDAQSGRGPIQAEQVLKSGGYLDLLRSFQIADPVVRKLRLYVKPERERDSLLFSNFDVEVARLRPGDYKLVVDKDRYSLALEPGFRVEEGVIGTPIGVPAGFKWQPSRAVLTGRGTVKFKVMTPREASIAVIRKLRWDLQEGSQFVFLNYRDDNAQRAANTLNTWVEQFVAVSTQLKKTKVSQTATILTGQLAYAEQNLRDAEAALESFRVRTISMPSERSTPIAPGLEITRDPVFTAYFDKKVLADQLRRDRESIERAVADGGTAGETLRPEQILSIPVINSDPAAEQIRKSLTELAEMEGNYRQLTQVYTTEYPAVKKLNDQITALRSQAIPRAVGAYLTTLKQRESDNNSRIAENTRELRDIPQRTIEEARLRRQVEVADQLYRSLQVREAEAKLADASTLPDINLLDPAVAPLQPTLNTKPAIILGAIGGSLALGVLLAILLDQFDKRFRYPEQVTTELGLNILGVVPTIGGKGSRRSTVEAAQVVEAFRSIRMNVRYAAAPGRPLTITITSPGPNDGKSLISSNLALSFAEAGARTLLIDGDTRRGELHSTFGETQRPGLVEYLDGTALIAEVLHPTAHANLTIIPSGGRKRRAPELLASPRLTQLIAQLAQEFDAIIVDSPPLGAGYDAYALGAATQNMALVMRSGMTDRKMASAKLDVLDRLPVRVVGAIVNGIKLEGAYQYYAYYATYSATDEATGDTSRASGDPTGPEEVARRA